MCKRSPGSGRNYVYCSPQIYEGDPGPVQVTIPAQQGSFELVIEASGFTASVSGFSGGMVIIDDLQYVGNGLGNCFG